MVLIPSTAISFSFCSTCHTRSPLRRIFSSSAAVLRTIKLTPSPGEFFETPYPADRNSRPTRSRGGPPGENTPTPAGSAVHTRPDARESRLLYHRPGSPALLHPGRTHHPPWADGRLRCTECRSGDTGGVRSNGQ